MKIQRRDIPPDQPRVHEHPVLARVLAARQVRDAADLDNGLEHLLPFSGLHGIDATTALLHQALTEGWRILVVGDFDADGATSCALAVETLRAFGAADVGYLVPNRFDYGYGLTPEIVQVAIAGDTPPDLIITVDNGIASVDGVATARGQGIHVLVTDHHLAPEHLPAADAIVNPNQPGDDFPSKNLAGVGVIFYVMLALRSRLRQAGWFSDTRPEPNLAQWLDLVALGTVADVVPLDRNNRILVAQGLARIRAGRSRPGILALLRVAKRDPGRVVAADLGFALGPRLNAAGRLEDMSQGIECLLCRDPAQAAVYAEDLDRMNRDRRRIEQDMQSEALAELQRLDRQLAGQLPLGVCLYDPGWHQGVIGILASRIKERLHRPVIAFARGDAGQLKGSARSVPGLHIRDVLDAVATRHPDLLQKFGGHAMAAGLTLDEARLPDFTAAFAEEVARHLSEDDLYQHIETDGELPGEHMNLETAGLLQSVSPWGQGFPEPLFDGRFTVVQQRIVGEKHLRLVLQTPDRAQIVDGIYFNAEDTIAAGLPRQIHIAYQLDINHYQGNRNLQLLIRHLLPAPVIAEAG